MTFSKAFEDELIKIAIGGESLSLQLKRYGKDVPDEQLQALRALGFKFSTPEEAVKALRHATAQQLAAVRASQIEAGLTPGQRGSGLALTRELTRLGAKRVPPEKLISKAMEGQLRIGAMKPHEKALEFEPWHSRLRRGFGRMSTVKKIGLGLGGAGALTGGGLLAHHLLSGGSKKAKR